MKSTSKQEAEVLNDSGERAGAILSWIEWSDSPERATVLLNICSIIGFSKNELCHRIRVIRVRKKKRVKEKLWLGSPPFFFRFFCHWMNTQRSFSSLYLQKASTRGILVSSSFLRKRQRPDSGFHDGCFLFPVLVTGLGRWTSSTADSTHFTSSVPSHGVTWPKSKNGETYLSLKVLELPVLNGKINRKEEGIEKKPLLILRFQISAWFLSNISPHHSTNNFFYVIC